jgi:hypothetical protein
MLKFGSFWLRWGRVACGAADAGVEAVLRIFQSGEQRAARPYQGWNAKTSAFGWAERPARPMEKFVNKNVTATKKFSLLLSSSTPVFTSVACI